MPTTKEVLQKLDLGKSVAEFDEDLETYFIETEAFRSLVDDKSDIIAGDKGTGKTAIYRILQKRFGGIPQLKDIQVLPAFNPRGSSIFEKLGDQGLLSEAEYGDLWKAYFLSLVGNWLLRVRSNRSASMEQLDGLLRGLDLREDDDSPASIFQRVLRAVKPLFNWKSAELTCAVTPEGKYSIGPKVEFAKESPANATVQTSISINTAYKLLDRCLREQETTVWIAVDRLDEAFHGAPGVEVPAPCGRFSVRI